MKTQKVTEKIKFSPQKIFGGKFVMQYLFLVGIFPVVVDLDYVVIVLKCLDKL